MARQARSEATRKKILDAAVDLFAEVGLPGNRTRRHHRARGDDQGRAVLPLRFQGSTRHRHHRGGRQHRTHRFPEHRRAVRARTGEHDPWRLRRRGPHPTPTRWFGPEPSCCGRSASSTQATALDPRPPVGRDGGSGQAGDRRGRPSGRPGPGGRRRSDRRCDAGRRIGLEREHRRGRSHRAHRANLVAAAARHRHRGITSRTSASSWRASRCAIRAT